MKKAIKNFIMFVTGLALVMASAPACVKAEATTEARNMASVVRTAKALDEHCSSSRTIDIDGTNYRYMLTHDDNGEIVFIICDSTDGLQALADALSMALK